MVERKVRTTEGARLFGQPIGSVITNRSSPDVQRTQRAVSLVRLKSIQRQFAAAKAVGDIGRMRDLQTKFSALLHEYSGSTQFMATLDEMVASRGRNDQALGKKKLLND